MDCDGFVVSFKTQNNINAQHNFNILLHFSNLNKNHQIFSDKSKKNVGKLKIETPKNIWIHEFIPLGLEANSFKEGKKQLKGIFKPQPKNFNFEGYCNCLFERDSQKKL